MQDAQTYKRIFEDNPDGVLILEDLMAIYARPVSKAKASEGINGVLETYQSLGESRVVQFIINQINKAHGVTEDE